MARAAAAMRAVVLAGVLLEAVGAGRAVAAGRAEVAGPVVAAVRVVTGEAVAAADRFRQIRLILKVSSDPEGAANFNKSFLLLVA